MNSNSISSSSSKTVHREDKLFFDHNPQRKFRARPYVLGDAPLAMSIDLSAAQHKLSSGEISITIIKRNERGRARRFFAGSQWPPLETDEEISAFLRLLRVDPDTFQWKAP